MGEILSSSSSSKPCASFSRGNSVCANSQKSIRSATKERIRFVFFDPMAKNVTVRAAFDDWKDRPLSRDQAGAWRCTTEAIPPGTYTYVFMVDGKAVPDPNNPRRNERPSGPIESILDVGTGDWPLPLHKGSVISPLFPKDESDFVALSLNVHAFQEKHDRFSKLCQIAKGLAHLNVDFASLNEVVYGKIFSRGYEGRFFDTAEILRKHVEAYTGQKWFLHQRGFGQWEDGEWLANAILSRYPLEDVWEQKLPTKDFWPAPKSKRNAVGARILLPNGKHLLAFVTHPMGFQHTDTRPQIQTIKAFVKDKITPTDLGAIVCGDFNVPASDTPTYNFLCQSPPKFQDLYQFPEKGNQPWATGPNGRARIDYIFWVAGQKRIVTPSRYHLVFDGNEHEGVMLPVVSDHRGILAQFSIARSVHNET